MNNVLEKVYKAGLSFLVPLTPEETYSLIVKEAIKLVKADSGSIYLERNNELERVYATEQRFFKIIPRKRGITYQVFKKRQPKITRYEDIAKIHPEIKALGIKSDIIVPLFYKNKSIGVLTVMSKKLNYFNESHLNILLLFSPLASLAIRKTELYDETKKALESRDLFISMAAHELRTPLTAISGYVQLLLGRMSDSDTAEARWIHHLHRETGRMTNLVNELLEINRIKSGKLNYQWGEYHLTGIVDNVINSFYLSHPDRKVIFEKHCEKNKDLIVADQEKIIQVITNLIENAIKYSPPVTLIKIQLMSKDKTVILTIQDNGSGIPKKEQDKIFDGFYQGENRVEGMGMGLYLVKDIVTRHKGTINVHSKVNHGTTMEVRFPGAKHD